MLFKIGGCTFKIDFLFILVLSFAALTGTDDLIYLLLFSSLHELGHLLALIICNGKPEKITFSYYGFALKYGDTLPRGREVIVALSGPAVNLILYLILKDDFNLILLFINLLPIYPLDGGRVLSLYFVKAYKVIGIFFLVLIYLLSFYLIFTVGSFSMLLIALYLTVYSLNN